MKRKRKLAYYLSCEDHWYSQRKWFLLKNKPNSFRTASNTKSFYNKNKALRAFEKLLSEGKNPLLVRFQITNKGHLLLNTWEKGNVN